MASHRMPEEFYDIVSHHLPPEEPPTLRGGRPPICHRIVMNVLWFVLTTGCRWEDVPSEMGWMGCSGRTAHRRLKVWEELGLWSRLHADLLLLLRRDDKLDPDLVVVDSVIVRAFGGGEATGPGPVDRRKRGSKPPTLQCDVRMSLRSDIPTANGTSTATPDCFVPLETQPIGIDHLATLVQASGNRRECGSARFGDRGDAM